MVRPKTEEKLMSNIMRSGVIVVMLYLGETFKVFTGKVYLVVDMQQHKCTYMIWKMFIWFDPCFHISTQHLIYSGQFQPLPTHKMPKVCKDGSFQDGGGNLFLGFQPS